MRKPLKKAPPRRIDWRSLILATGMAENHLRALVRAGKKPKNPVQAEAFAKALGVTLG
jgi:hypothetical protein